MSKLKQAWASLEFWWARKKLKDGRDFELQFDELGLLVTVLTGYYASVQFRFANMVVHEEGLLDFSTVVVYNPQDADVTREDFVKLSNNILRIILDDAVRDTSKLNIAKPLAEETIEQVIDENRNVDTGELNQERELHEEVSPLLEKRVSKRKPRKKAVPADSGSHSEIQQPAKPKRTRNRTPRKNGPK